MASRQARLVALVAAIVSLAHLTTALQVSPDSPCSSFCIDAPDLDESDPESSNTVGKEITCNDDDFTSKPAGQKFQRCLACLQDSAYTWGDESDQQWFIYNLRYSVNYCVLGYPNATDFEYSPCALDVSCGALEEALTDGILDPAYAEPYSFCDKDGGSILSDRMDACKNCVAGSDSHTYLTNFLTAIEAGCEQKPLDGVIVGLDDTVFTTQTIQIVDPSSSASSSSSDGGVQLSPPIIAGIAIGGLAFVLLIAGCIFVQIRKRRNRQARLRRASPLSFRCQTHVTPRTPNFPRGQESVDDEKPYLDPAAALHSNPVIIRQQPRPGQLSGITATSVPSPAPVHSSPVFASPVDQYKTPTSTTSTRSNMPLLGASSSYKPYVPSEYGIHDSATPGIAVSTPEVVPYVEQQGVPSQANNTSRSPQRTLRITTTRWDRSGATNFARGQARMSTSPGSPVSFTQIQTSFPPPPSPKKR